MSKQNDMATKTKTFTKANIEADSFKDYISISSDSLLVINRDLELVEWIIQGHDNNGVYISADNEDEFLDAIIVLKNIILNGDNPLKYLG